MTDLIKRLHHHANGDCDMTPVGSTLLEAADRIEELVKERDDLRKFDDYFRSTCGFKRDGRDSSKCLDDFLAGINRQDIPIPFDHFLQVQKERGELKSRIEELEAACWRMQEDRDRAIGWRDHNWTRADAAEAKLTKAVEVLRNILKGDDMYPWRIAREVLAELEKE